MQWYRLSISESAHNSKQFLLVILSQAQPHYKNIYAENITGVDIIVMYGTASKPNVTVVTKSKECYDTI